MIEVIKKRELDNTNIIFIKAEEGDFVFTFCGNYDLYFSYFGKDLRKKDEHSFMLDDNNYFLYKCFDDLYSAIENEKPFMGDKTDANYVFAHKNFFDPLFKNGKIEWHSDDGHYNNSAILCIEKMDETYKITIKEGLISDINIRTASVRFRNSGSMYYPYNCTFMNLYNKLCEHNFEYEQITMDEYMDRIKIRKR